MPLLSQALPSFSSLVFPSSLGLPFWVPWQEIWDFLFLVLFYVWLWPHLGPRNARIQEEKENIRELPSVDQKSKFLSCTNILVSFVLMLSLLSQGRGRSMVGEDGPKELIGMPPPSPERHSFPSPWAKIKNLLESLLKALIFQPIPSTHWKLLVRR